MTLRIALLSPLVLTLGMLPALTTAPATAGPSRPYDLGSASKFEVGCWGPCACPLLILSPLEGRFDLSPIDTDGPEVRYDVTDIAWTAHTNGGDLDVSGSGVYRILGGSPRTHQMTLTLRVNNQPDEVFDSGVVPGGDDFPAIKIAMASGGFFCWDSVFTIDAVAAVAGIPALPTGGLGFAAAWPNPFRESIALRVRLPADDRLDLSVHDAAGRLVRSLARGRALPAGVHPFEWDGRREDGSLAPAGFYLARVSGRNAQAVQALIRL
jgi:hypothetical protein